MPNRPIHLATSGPIGAAFDKAPANNNLQRLQESVGGALGGLLGVALPDIFDPPLHPGHRAMAHALIPVSAGAAAWSRQLDNWQAGLRAGLGAGYLTHIALDFTTPRCLPLLS